MTPTEKQTPETKDSPLITKEQIRIAKEIEAVFEKFYGGKTAYSRGQFYKEDFFLRTDYALVVLNKNNEILVSFADHTRPSYAALFAFMLEGIEGANLYICEELTEPTRMEAWSVMKRMETRQRPSSGIRKNATCCGA